MKAETVHGMPVISATLPASEDLWHDRLKACGLCLLSETVTASLDGKPRHTAKLERGYRGGVGEGESRVLALQAAARALGVQLHVGGGLSDVDFTVVIPDDALSWGEWLSRVGVHYYCRPGEGGLITVVACRGERKASATGPTRAGPLRKACAGVGVGVEFEDEPTREEIDQMVEEFTERVSPRLDAIADAMHADMKAGVPVAREPRGLAGRIVEALGGEGWELHQGFSGFLLSRGRLVVEGGRCYLTWQSALGAGRTEIPLSWWSRRRIRRAARRTLLTMVAREVPA